jgi:hypothetical protein
VSTFVDRGVSRGQRGGSPTVVNLSFLDQVHPPREDKIDDMKDSLIDDVKDSFYEEFKSIFDKYPKYHMKIWWKISMPK